VKKIECQLPWASSFIGLARSMTTKNNMAKIYHSSEEFAGTRSFCQLGIIPTKLVGQNPFM
jgi:hypothetical protein